MKNEAAKETGSSIAEKADIGKNKSQGKSKGKIALYIVLIALFLGAMAFLTVRFGPQLTELAKDPGKLSDKLNSYGWKGILLFIGIQILQVVVAAIPGELVQIAGGYIYGTWLGTLYSITGILIGSVLVFFIARIIGYPLVKLLVSREQLEKFNFMINGDKSEAGMFLLFLIPGIPKDILTYIAGITPVRPLRFFIIITIARLPALIASSVIGSSTEKGNYVMVIILSVAALILFLAGLFLKDRIIDRIKKMSKSRES
ncbi:MAG TPA: TVP38/TMEM64 family protein [Clostridia bacterium]|nr:TVP38/TMEM64 family protein [Clostridia bacterium]